jgi:hypothetical protein
MRELYIYYRVSTERATAAWKIAESLQQSLVDRYPGLVARLLRKEGGAPEMQTWMEIYTAPSGVSRAIQADIDESAVALSPHISGERHVEVFLA